MLVPEVGVSEPCGESCGESESAAGRRLRGEERVAIEVARKAVRRVALPGIRDEVEFEELALYLKVSRRVPNVGSSSKSSGSSVSGLSAIV